MKNGNTNQIADTGAGNSADSGFGWLDERWFCGTPDERCRYCGLPQIFPPASLGIEVCRCNDVISENRGFTVAVCFSRIQSFKVKIIERRSSPPCSSGNSQLTLSGGFPSRRRSPDQEAWKAFPRAHDARLRSVMPRPANFNFSSAANAPS